MSTVDGTAPTPPTADGTPGDETSSPAAGRPVLDVFAVLAAMQQQLDDLREVVQAQQRSLQAQLGDEQAGTASEPVSSRPVRASR